MEKARAILKLAYALAFYPAVFAIMIWLLLTGRHWIWGVLVILAVLILDPIYRIIGRRFLIWRPHPRDKPSSKK